MVKDIFIMSHVALRLNNNIVIIGGLDLKYDGESPLPMHEIFMYNLYTEQWRTHHISGDKLPTERSRTCATVIENDIYMFAGWNYDTHATFNDLWKLTSIGKGGFTWCKIEFQCGVKLPARRYDHRAWQYEDCMFVLGGRVDLKDHPEYLKYSYYGEFSDGVTNQLLSYDPSTQRWENLQSLGTVPSPRIQPSTASIGDKVWLLGGCDTLGFRIKDNCFFQLDMKSYTWTQTRTNNKIPNSFSSLAAISNTQLVLHVDTAPHDTSDIWIIDLPSSTWRQFSSKDESRCHQTCSAGVNRCAIIIGGVWPPEEPELQQTSKVVFKVMLEPKSLKQLAMKIIYNEQDELEWMCLPPKLIAELGLIP